MQLLSAPTVGLALTLALCSAAPSFAATYGLTEDDLSIKATPALLRMVDFDGRRLEIEAAANAGDAISQLLVAGNLAQRTNLANQTGARRALALARQARAGGVVRGATIECVILQSPVSGLFDAKAAFEACSYAAANGNASGKALLGALYLRGVGAQASLPTAIRLWEETAAQNVAFAQANLGVLYEEGNGVAKDPAKAFALFSRAAAQDFAVGQFLLGRAYGNGTGVAKDTNRAFKLIEQSAAGGDPQGLCGLGKFYFSGQYGPAKDVGKAVALFKESAERGLAQCQDLLARAYIDGVGVPKDPALVATWMELAGNGGWPASAQYMGYILEQGVGVTKNPTLARLWNKRGMELGDKDARDDYANMLIEGVGGAKDPVAALTLIRASAADGSSMGKYMLAREYQEGKNIPANYAEALRLYQSVAIVPGLGMAYSRIAQMYYYGQGVPKSLPKAIEFRQKAVAAGDPDVNGSIALLEAEMRALQAPKATPAPKPAPPRPVAVAAPTANQILALSDEYNEKHLGLRIGQPGELISDSVMGEAYRTQRRISDVSCQPLGGATYRCSYTLSWRNRPGEDGSLAASIGGLGLALASNEGSQRYSYVFVYEKGWLSEGMEQSIHDSEDDQ